MEYTNYKESSFLYNVKCLAALRASYYVKCLATLRASYYVKYLAALRASCNVRGSGFPLPLS